MWYKRNIKNNRRTHTQNRILSNNFGLILFILEILICCKALAAEQSIEIFAFSITPEAYSSQERLVFTKKNGLENYDWKDCEFRFFNICFSITMYRSCSTLDFRTISYVLAGGGEVWERSYN